MKLELDNQSKDISSTSTGKKMEFNMTEVLFLAKNSSTRKLILIEFGMLLMAFAAFLLAVSGSCRRRCSSGFLSLLQRLSYTLAIGQLFSLTTGQMLSAPFRNELFALWGAFIFIFFGQNDSFSAYSLEDNEQWRRYSSQVSYQALLVGFMIGFYVGLANFGWYALAITAFITYKADEKTTALKMASRSSLAEDTKLISDFMACEHLISTDAGLNPIHMKGYNYLVAGESENMVKVKLPQYQKQLDVTRDEVVTLQKIWQCQGRLLTGETGQWLKDICLSFALFKLLCRRFGGHPFSESSHEKTWRFVRHGLLSREGDYNRAFRVIEVELCFLFDLFYTKYAVIFNRGRGFGIGRLLNTVIVIGLGGYVAVNILLKYEPSVHELNLITAGGVDIDKRVTSILMVIILLMEFAQYLFLIISDWATVRLICNYVRGRNSWFQIDDSYLMLLRTKMVLLCHHWFKPWERKLGQYSLLTSFNRDPCRFKMKCWLTCFFADAVNVPKQGRKGNTKIELPEEVKKAVMLTLRRTNGRKLSNGENSLQRNQVWDELFWACQLETPTHVILVWHLATSLCMISTRPRSLRNEDFIVATRLSDYCAYLVAFAPRLISENATDSEFIFNEVLKDARNILKECNSDREKYEKIMMNKLGEEESIRYSGAKLASDLQQLQNEMDFMWKVLADFWAEFMLFVAPCGDPRAHVEHLAKGGEFVTHLWALLSHAGILNNGSTLQDV